MNTTGQQMNTIGQRIREARKTRGLTIQKLAKKAEIHPNTLLCYEHGYSLPGIYALIQLADILEVPLDWLAGREAPTNDRYK